LCVVVQWQTYGYIPSALPDSNCFGGQQTEQQQAAAGGVNAQAATPAGAAAALQQASFHGQLEAPELDSRMVGPLLGGLMHLPYNS
jgi:hypothetical protein